MKFVCLLRGINVGGNKKVDMKTLKSKLLDSGYFNVLTYINSGNIIFESDEKDVLLHQQKIHQLIIDVFHVDSKVLVIEKSDYLKIAKNIPVYFKNDDTFKADVLFYYQDITQDLIDSIPVKKDIDETIYLKDALIIGVARENQPKSGLDKMVGTKVYGFVTIRNVNTVRKIYDLITES